MIPWFISNIYDPVSPVLAPGVMFEKQLIYLFMLDLLDHLMRLFRVFDSFGLSTKAPFQLCFVCGMSSALACLASASALVSLYTSHLAID